MKKVLNVGGNNKQIPLPTQYLGWQHLLLDIDPNGQPDVVCDARNLADLPSSTFDSVYCSHNLEHYYRHDVAKVLAGFVHIVKDDGFVCIRVPDLAAVMRAVVEKNLDIDDALYESDAGSIKVSDVIYGYGVEIERSGNDYYAHKTGFTQKSLTAVLFEAGFRFVFSGVDNFEIVALAFLNEPTIEAKQLLNLPKLA
jgi:SAM-dependent methyltransferase